MAIRKIRFACALLAACATQGSAWGEPVAAPKRPLLKPLAVLLGEGGAPADVFAQGVELCFLKTLGKDAAARAGGWRFSKKPDGTYEKRSGSDRIVVEDGPGAACRALVFGRPADAAIQNSVFNFENTYGRTLKLNYAWRFFPAFNQDWLNLRYEAADGFGFVTLIRNKPEKSGAPPQIAYVAKVEVTPIATQSPVALEEGVRAGLDACSGVFNADRLEKSAVSEGFSRTSEREFSRPLMPEGSIVLNWNAIVEKCFVTVQSPQSVGMAAKVTAQDWLQKEVGAVDVELDGSQNGSGKYWSFTGKDEFFRYEMIVTVYDPGAASVPESQKKRVVISLGSEVSD